MWLNLSTNLPMFVYTFQAMWRHRPLEEYLVFVGIRAAHTSISPFTLVTPVLILNSIHSTATDRRRAMSQSNILPVRNRPPLTTRSSGLRCASAAEHHTAEQYSKTGRTKPWKHLPRSYLSCYTRQTLSRYQVFQTLLWKLSEDASQITLYE